MRAYRWLTRIHPPGPRRAELLGTLLDGAPPGRRWPASREIQTMIRYGLRARLGRPASRGVVVLAVLAALLTGLAGASAASWLGWQAAPALPSGAEADEIARTALPGMTVWGGGDAPVFVPSGDGESTRYGYVTYWARHTAATRDVLPFTTAARDRLVAAGWDLVTDLGVDAEDGDRGATFVVARGDLVLAFSDDVRQDVPSYDSGGHVSYDLARSATWWQWAGTLTGALLGGLAGWLLTGWASRRSEHRPVLARGGAVLAGIGFALTVPVMLLALAWLASEPGFARPWDESLFLGLRWMPGLVQLPVCWLVPGGFLLAALAGGIRVTRRGLAVAGVLAVAAAGTTAAVVLPGEPAPAVASSCTPRPGVVPAERPAGAVRASTVAYVFVDQGTAPDRRNLIQAAINRVLPVHGYHFEYDPRSETYRHAYCGGAPLPAGVGATLPYLFEVDLQSPGVFAGLVHEVAPQPGVLAVQRGLPRDA